MSRPRGNKKTVEEQELSGEAVSLYGRVDLKQMMGDRALGNGAPATNETDGQKNNTQQKKVLQQSARVNTKNGKKIDSVLDALKLADEYAYQPLTEESHAAYDKLLSIVSKYASEYAFLSQSIVNECIQIVRDADGAVDNIEESLLDIIGPESSEDLSQILDLLQQLISADQSAQVGDNYQKFSEVAAIDIVDEDDAADLQSSQQQFTNEVQELDNDDDDDLAIQGIIEAGLRDEDQQKDVDSAKLGGLDLDAQSINSGWLQSLLMGRFSAVESQRLSRQILQLLLLNQHECEDGLLDLLGDRCHDLVQILSPNKDLIYYAIKLSEADVSERDGIIEYMVRQGLSWILKRLNVQFADFDDMQLENENGGTSTLKMLDIHGMAFRQGAHTMTNDKVTLPEGSYKKTKADYEEIVIPAMKAAPFSEDEQLVPIGSLPEWTRAAFKNTKTLNRVQSRLYPVAFESGDENILLCAPTGAGKTNVAVLTILNILDRHRSAEDGSFNTDQFKIVYVAPMKALVAEVVGNLRSRLSESYGISVAELTGDKQLSGLQIAETQILVTTPEKWDVITRKVHDGSYVNLVRLLIIDEIHLLHDTRGPVLESIVARTLRQQELTGSKVRLVGLSATLPNYEDVAQFLHVKNDVGLFHFDNSYRPCPLQQNYIGITEKRPLKRHRIMNQIVYDKVIAEAGKNQMIVFVHSRSDTAKTAKFLRDQAVEKNQSGAFIHSQSQSREILRNEAGNCKNIDLADLLPYGFAIHHAGMSRSDRSLVEDLFADRHVQVLVSTATLAWGVNLPAHTVIIKGTQVYSPEKGDWIELSPQDVLQMLGRAGRPQYDTFGEGIIITTQDELQFYLSLLNTQLPIESQLIAKLPDILNAEIVAGTVKNRDEAINWLEYTYLFTRMRKSPSTYFISEKEIEEDPQLDQKRVQLVHTALMILSQSHLLHYDVQGGDITSNELGKIASYYYIAHESMVTYIKHLDARCGMLELFRIFAMSEEFKFITVRLEERVEMSRLIEQVPIPVAEPAEDPLAKVNVLLQCYISQLKLEQFSLMSDMVYITQSAGRLMRALFEICLHKKWAHATSQALELCKMVHRRMWSVMTPLRQLPGAVDADILRRLERKEFPWQKLVLLNPQELGELVRNPKAGRVLKDAIQQIPRLDVQASIQPITMQKLKIELQIGANFTFNDQVHNPGGETFWILVVDGDGSSVLHYEQFVLYPDAIEDQQSVSFHVPVLMPLHPNYFVSVVSDAWIKSESRIALSFKNLILPPPADRYIEIAQDYPCVSVDSVLNQQLQQYFHDQYNADSLDATTSVVLNHITENGLNQSLLVTSSVSPNASIIQDFSLIMYYKSLDMGSDSSQSVSVDGKIVVISLNEQSADESFQRLQKLAQLLNVRLYWQKQCTDINVEKLNEADILLACASSFEVLSRRWKSIEFLQKMSLCVVSDTHLIMDSSDGYCLEQCIMRMKYIQLQLESAMSIVATGYPVANAKDLGTWLGCQEESVFNFAPSVDSLRDEVVEVLPVESTLVQGLHNFLNAEICNKSVESQQEAVEFLSLSFWMRRLYKNPNYYNLIKNDAAHISEFLSEAVETVIGDLQEVQCIDLAQDGEEIVPQSLGLIASYHGIDYLTIDMFSQSASHQMKLKVLLEMLAMSAEFSTLLSSLKLDKGQIRSLYEHCVFKLAADDRGRVNFNDPKTAIFTLLQAYFSRMKISDKLKAMLDQKILPLSVNLVYALVDVLSTAKMLDSVITSIELCQMLIQSMWSDRDSPLKQLPFFDANRLQKASDFGIESIYDLAEVDDSVREQLFEGLSEDQVQLIAETANRYPQIETQFAINGNHHQENIQVTVDARSTVTIDVHLSRDQDDNSFEDNDLEGLNAMQQVKDDGDDLEKEECLPPVLTINYPDKERQEGWWFIVGKHNEGSPNELVSIKRVHFVYDFIAKLQFQVPSEGGEHKYQLLLLSDSWVGCDQEYSFTVVVTQE
ncbi:hypothetical protein MP228_002058 [Amoeboaphelidium protococcarum]|nr:hypothetical protein MP228_002058 [Amoeboaphelidium protococcarum]